MTTRRYNLRTITFVDVDKLHPGGLPTREDQRTVKAVGLNWSGVARQARQHLAQLGLELVEKRHRVEDPFGQVWLVQTAGVLNRDQVNVDGRG